jgi:hypothetical protein
MLYQEASRRQMHWNIRDKVLFLQCSIPCEAARSKCNQWAVKYVLDAVFRHVILIMRL